MAFDTASQRITAVAKAGNVHGHLKSVYAFSVMLRDVKAVYTAGTDPVLTAAFNAVYTPSDRAAISAMIAQLETLIADWEANRADVIA